MKKLGAGIIILFVVIECFFSATAVSSEKAHIYTDPGVTIEVVPGEEFSVSMESNATTGYKWELAKRLDLEILGFKGSEYKDPEDAVVGQGGNEIWKFKALSEGETMISFKYVRPWEKDMYPLETRMFIVIVSND